MTPSGGRGDTSLWQWWGALWEPGPPPLLLPLPISHPAISKRKKMRQAHSDSYGLPGRCELLRELQIPFSPAAAGNHSLHRQTAVWWYKALCTIFSGGVIFPQFLLRWLKHGSPLVVVCGKIPWEGESGSVAVRVPCASLPCLRKPFPKSGTRSKAGPLQTVRAGRP